MDNFNNRISRYVTIAGIWMMFIVLMITVSLAAGCEAKKPFDLSSVPGPPTESYSSPTIIRPIGF